MGAETVAPLILSVVARWRRVEGFTPQPLYPLGNSLRDPFNKSDWVHSRSGRFGEEKNMLPRTGVEQVVMPEVCAFLPDYAASVVRRGCTR
jgi:hypothetical protein